VKILQIHNQYRHSGGEDAVVESEADVLRQAGHDVHQLIERNPTNDVAAAGRLLLAPWNPQATGLIGEIVDEIEPDVAHVHNTWFALTPAIFRTLRKRHIPVVLTLHNYRLTCSNGLLLRDEAPCELCVGTNPWHAVRYGCYRDSRMASIPAAATIRLHQLLGTWVKDVDVFIALTEMQRKIMIRAGLPEERIMIKPHFVSDPGRRSTSPSESNVVLYAGRLSPEKGVRLLLDAWGDSAPPKLELIIAGEGPERVVLEQDLPPRTRMLGHLSSRELATVMLSARAMFMPSLWYEGFPRVLVEAFSAGLPTAVSDDGGPAEIVTHALGPQWLFRAREPSSLRQVLHAMTDDERCDASGVMARQAFEQSFSRDQAADRLIEVYSNARSAKPSVP